MGCLTESNRFKGVTPENRPPCVRGETVREFYTLPNVIDGDLAPGLRDFDRDGSGIENPVFTA
jgi:hypothetical protein